MFQYGIFSKIAGAILTLTLSQHAIARDAFSAIQAESYNNRRAFAVKTSTYLTDADELRFDDVVFGSGAANKVEFRLAVPAKLAGQKIEVRTDSRTGTLLGTLTTASTGSSAVYTTQSLPIASITGSKKIFLTFPNSKTFGRFDSFKFVRANAPVPPAPVPVPPTPVPPIPVPPTPVPPTSSAGCPAGAIMIAVGSNIQTIVNAQATNVSFCLAAGEHRMQSVQPKAGQKFFGQPGAVMNGSRLLTSFTQEANLFVASGQTQQGERISADECEEGNTRCGYPDAFYINDVALSHVDTKAKVAAGKYFFDYAADKIYFMDNPAGKKVEAAVSPNAFGGTAFNVTIDSIKITKYASPLQRCAIQGQTGWIIQNNDVSLTHGIGICTFTNGKILNNKIYDNGEMGIGCGGNDVLIEGNEIARNGFFSGIDVM